MKKPKPLHAPAAARTTRLPARVADAQLDHLERMIMAFAISNQANPLGCLDRTYFHKRLSTLVEESDLVSVQRARVLKLLNILDQSDSKTGPEQAAA